MKNNITTQEKKIIKKKFKEDSIGFQKKLEQKQTAPQEQQQIPFPELSMRSSMHDSDGSENQIVVQTKSPVIRNSQFKKSKSKKLKEQQEIARKRHRSMDDLQQIAELSSSKSSTEEEEEEEEEGQQERNNAKKQREQEEDGVVFSDCDALTYKGDDYMKGQNNNSDFEEDLIRELKDEQKKGKMNNGEENESEDEDDDDSDDDEEEDIEVEEEEDRDEYDDDEQEQLNNQIMPTIEEEQYAEIRKQLEEEEGIQNLLSKQQMQSEERKKKQSLKETNKNLDQLNSHNTKEKLKFLDKITGTTEKTPKKLSKKERAKAEEEEEEGENDEEGEVEDLAPISPKNHISEKATLLENQKTPSKGNRYDDSIDQAQIYEKQQEKQKSVEKNQKEIEKKEKNITSGNEVTPQKNTPKNSDINGDDDYDDNDQQVRKVLPRNSKQIKVTAQYLQQQQEKRKEEIQKRKQQRHAQKQQKKHQQKLKKLEKNKSNNKKSFQWGIYKRLLIYTRKQWKLSMLGSLSMIVMAITQIFVPRICGDLLDATIKDKNFDLLSNLAYQALFIFIMHALADTTRTFLFNLLGEKIIQSLTSDCFTKFMQADIEFHDKLKSGELTSRITTDIATAKAAASGNVGNLFRHIIISVGYVAILLYMSWKLSIVILICVPIFIYSSNFYGAFTKKMVKKYQKVVSKGTSLATECFINIRTVKSFSNEELEINRYKRKQHKGYLIGKEKAISLALHNGMESLLSNGAKLCVLWYGGYLVIQSEQLTSGQLASFILYTNSLASSASSITSCLQKISTATGACERLFKLMDYEPKINYSGGKKFNNFNGLIQFKNVDFSYPTTPDVKTLSNFNLSIEQGEQVAFVGSSGSGKSTIIRLIERFYDVQNGVLEINGENIKNLNLQSLRTQIGYVSQEPVLFSGSIEENLTYGVGQEYTEADLDDVTKLACAYDFIHDLNLFPKGYRTQVGEQGAKLSGGQKQRIAIARALMKKPKILIFDEATSALDAESEFQVQSAIDHLMTECSMTIIIIAHRLSTIVNCEKIVVLNQGKIIGAGSHYELIENNEMYKSLIERQMQALQNN